MKKRILILFMLSWRFCVGQAIDSVMVSRCAYIEDFTDTNYAIAVDSFDVNGLLINSYSYDTSWNVKGRTVNSYSPSRLLLYQVMQWYDTSNWTTYNEIINLYDLNDSIIDARDYSYHYNLGVLTDTSCYRNSYSRDTLNNAVTNFRYNYVDLTNTWDTNYATINYFDSLNRVTRSVNETPGPSGYLEVHDSTWYYYLANDSVDSYLQFGTTGTMAADRYQYFYNLQDYLVQLIDSAWYIPTQTRHADWIRQYYRDTSNLVTAVSFHYFIDTLGTVDPCGDTTTYFYNASHQQTYHSIHYCGFGGNYGSMAYDSTGNLIHQDYCSYGGMGDQHCYECDYSYYTFPFTAGIHLTNDIAPGIRIFPNPSAGTFTIQNLRPEETTTVQVINPVGEIIYRDVVRGVSEYFVSSNLVAGIYFVSVNHRSGTEVGKLVVQ